MDITPTTNETSTEDAEFLMRLKTEGEPYLLLLLDPVTSKPAWATIHKNRHDLITKVLQFTSKVDEEYHNKAKAVYRDWLLDNQISELYDLDALLRRMIRGAAAPLVNYYIWIAIPAFDSEVSFLPTGTFNGRPFAVSSTILDNLISQATSIGHSIFHKDNNYVSVRIPTDDNHTVMATSSSAIPSPLLDLEQLPAVSAFAPYDVRKLTQPNPAMKDLYVEFHVSAEQVAVIRKNNGSESLWCSDGECEVRFREERLRVLGEPVVSVEQLKELIRRMHGLYCSNNLLVVVRWL